MSQKGIVPDEMPSRPKATDGTDRDGARQLLVSLRDVSLESYSVVGPCLRFDEQSRNTLKEFRQRLAESFFSKSLAPKNFLLWGAPGSGKSYLVQQTAKSLPSEVHYHELNLAQLDQASLRSGLEAFVAAPGPGLCFIDEVDARSDQTWPYETLLPYLEPPVPRRFATAYCLAGSGGDDLSELTKQIRARPKGSDLLSRIPGGNEFTVASLGAGDKILVSIAQLVLAAQEEGHTVREIEKLALYFLAVHPTFTSARQLRSRATQCALRIPPAEDRIRYDYLFGAGDPENKQFWTDSEPVRTGLQDSFVRVGLGSLFAAEGAGASASRAAQPEIVREGPSIPRIAVLPFANISPDPKDEYFADGLTEEMITVLSHVPELRVIARTSVMQYKSSSKPIVQVGAELGVSSILEGSVRRAGNHLRITAQLIDVDSEEHLWAATYDRGLDDVFVIQAEVAERTAKSLRLELLGPGRESIRKKPTSSFAAYDLYLKGIHAAHQPTIEAMSESIPFFEEAIRQDPKFSQAYSHLANMYILLAGVTLPGREALPRAKELIVKALELDPDSSDAHAAAGNLAMQEDQDWATAETEFKRAISLNPGNATAHFWYTSFLMLVQRFDEAREENRTVIELDPLWVSPRFTPATIDYLTGRLESATVMVKELAERNPGDTDPPRMLGWIHLKAGRRDEARKEAEVLDGFAMPPGPAGDVLRRERAILWAALGRPEEARRLAEESEEAPGTGYLNPVTVASIYAVLGEKEKALEWLERAYQEGERWLPFGYLDMPFDSIRDDPRFRAMLERLNLPTDTNRGRDAGARR